MLTKPVIGKKSDAHDSKESPPFTSQLKKRGTRDLTLTSCQKDFLKFLQWCLDLDLFGKANLTDLLGRMPGVLETLPKPLYNLSLYCILSGTQTQNTEYKSEKFYNLWARYLHVRISLMKTGDNLQPLNPVPPLSDEGQCY